MREMLERNGFGHDVEGALDEETRENYLRMEEYAYRMRQQHHPGAAPGEFVGTPEDLEAIMKLMKDFGTMQDHVLERERHESARFTGCHVTLKDLEGAKELNGRVGKCVRWIEDRSRMEVKLLDDDGNDAKTACVKMEKMELIIDEASLSGCAACGAKTAAKRESGKLEFCPCYAVRYCNKDCSKKHWQAHKPEHEKHMELMCVLDIPATIAKAKELGAFAATMRTSPAHGRNFRATEGHLAPGKRPNKPFLIKVQIPMISNKRGEDLGMNGAISIYNQKRTLNVMFLPGNQYDTTFRTKMSWPKVWDAVERLGTNPLVPRAAGGKGVKAYFSARIAKGDKLVIDVSKVMPDPGW